jgi:hypothetical protein
MEIAVGALIVILALPFVQPVWTLGYDTFFRWRLPEAAAVYDDAIRLEATMGSQLTEQGSYEEALEQQYFIRLEQAAANGFPQAQFRLALMSVRPMQYREPNSPDCFFWMGEARSKMHPDADLAYC